MRRRDFSRRRKPLNSRAYGPDAVVNPQNPPQKDGNRRPLAALQTPISVGRGRRMASRARKQKTIERRWRERFGEPPSLLTDPDLMLRILEADERKVSLAAPPTPTCHPSVA